MSHSVDPVFVSFNHHRLYIAFSTSYVDGRLEEAEVEGSPQWRRNPGGEAKSRGGLAGKCSMQIMTFELYPDTRKIIQMLLLEY